MKTWWIGALAAFCARALCAQDLTGDWQGTLKGGPQELRVIIQLAKGDAGGWKGTLLSIDQGIDWGAGAPVSSVTLEGSALKLTVDALRGTYEGKVSEDGASIQGTWTQNRGPRPLELERATPETVWKHASPHAVRFVTVDASVDTNVKLEVLDWGGTGRPLVLVSGLGNTAHVYDKFVGKLTPAYHVYGITRRGFGASSAPASGYSADRLGDDVLAVIASLALPRAPVLAGHSIGGQELSSIGSRHPEKVAGLIYLDAGYSYAFYDRQRGDFNIDLLELQKKLERLKKMPPNTKELIQELLSTSLPMFAKDLQVMEKDLQVAPNQEVQSASRAIIEGEQKYTEIRAPILSIFAVPHDPGRAVANNPAALAAFEARDATTEAQAKAFETGLPNARVVRLPRADHYVFVSNEADVLREMNAFISSLP